VFCGLSEFQLSLYRLFIQAPEIKALLRGVNSQPLKAINILKKLCNHPELLDLPKDLHGSDNLIPEGFCGAGSSARDRGRNQGVRCDWGGKFLVLERYAFGEEYSNLVKLMLIDSCIAYERRRQIRSFLSAITHRLWICSRSFVEARSRISSSVDNTMPNQVAVDTGSSDWMDLWVSVNGRN
jgi:hypothetical protein